MTDQVKELISALMDGEASEIEIHRLLRQIKEDDSHREVWVTYQETRRVLRADSKSGNPSIHLSRAQHLELHQRISDAVAEDSSHKLDTDSVLTPAASSNKVSRSSLYKPAAGLAVAASLVVALFVGLQQEQPGGLKIASKTEAPVVQAQVPVVAAQPVLNEVAQVQQNGSPGSEPELVEPALKELDAEGQRRLRAYLNQHDAMARMRQNTQMVNYSKQRGK